MVLVWRVEVGEEDVLVAVTVEVGGVDAHRGFRGTVHVDRDSGQRRLVGEAYEAVLASALVDPQLVRCLVIGDVDVRPTVEVEIGGDHPERGTELARDAGHSAHILESDGAIGAGTAVAPQAVGDRVVGAWAAVIPGARGREAGFVGGDGEIDVVADVEVEPAVTVEVERKTTLTLQSPPVTRRLRSGDPLEGAVATITPATGCRTDVGHVEIGRNRRRRGRRRPSRPCRSHVESIAALRGHVDEDRKGESPFADHRVVAVEAIGQPGMG